MIEFANGIYVDSVMIIVVDKSWFEKHKDKTPNYTGIQEIEIENGKYRVDWEIPDTWNGDVNGVGWIDVTSGKIVVSDPCYWFDKNWHTCCCYY